MFCVYSLSSALSLLTAETQSSSRRRTGVKLLSVSMAGYHSDGGLDRYRDTITFI